MPQEKKLICKFEKENEDYKIILIIIKMKPLTSIYIVKCKINSSSKPMEHIYKAWGNNWPLKQHWKCVELILPKVWASLVCILA